MKDVKDADRDVKDGPSRRRFLGGALASALAAMVLRDLRPSVKEPDRWKGKTRWIGHC